MTTRDPFPLMLDTVALRMFRDELARRHGKARRRLASRDVKLGLLAWGREYLPDHFSRPPSRMHRWLGAQLDSLAECRAKKINLLAPRGAAKSSIGSMAYPLQAAVERREPYIWIVSDTRDQARAHLENIKSELLDNHRLRRDYPRATGKGPVWTAGRIVLRNGTAIEAYGTGQRIRGRRYRADRPSLILCDDLENDEHIHSALARQRSRTWFQGTLLKAGASRTNVVNLATALHREALAVRLEETPGWTSRVFQAIERWPDDMELWAAWEAIYTALDNPRYKQEAAEFYQRHSNRMDAGAVVLWPEEESLYTLMCMRVEGGRTAFEREKQNSPINPDLCEWPEEYFSDALWFDTWPEALQVKTLALDPSKGADTRRGDYSAFIMLGVDQDGILYVDADLARRPTSRIIADGVELYHRFQPDAFGIEANQFQELLGGEFEAEFRRRGMLGVHPWLLNNRVNKHVRIRRLGPYLAGGRLKIKANSPSARILVDQLREFPVGDHDDGPDAVEMAVRLAAGLLRKGSTDDGLPDRLPVG